MEREVAIAVQSAGLIIKSQGYECPAGTYLSVQDGEDFKVAFVGPDKVVSTNVDGVRYARSDDARNMAACYASGGDRHYGFTLKDAGLTDLPMKGDYEPADDTE